MKGMLKQTGNELIKIWRQLGYRILLFVIAGLMLAAPLMNFFFGRLVEGNFSVTWSEASEDDIWGVYSNTQRKYLYTFFEENKLPEWKQSIYSNELAIMALQLKGLELLVNGKFEVYDVISCFPVNVDDVCEYNNEESESKYYEWDWIVAHYSPEKTKQSYERVLGEFDQFTNKIISITEKEVIKEYLDDSEEELTQAEVSLTVAKSKYELENTEKHKIELNNAQKAYDYQLMITEGWRFAYEKGREPLGWEFNLLDELMPMLANQALSCMPVSDSDYEISPTYIEILNIPMPYSIYVRNSERNVKYYEDAIRTYHMAILHNAPLSQAEDISTKGGIRDTLMSFINIMSIFMVVLVSGIISSEFSSGTVRLLLIRPRSRIQIISAKLLASLTVYVVSVAAMTVLLSVEHLIFFGIGDYFTGDVVSLFGINFVIPGALMLFGKIFVASLPVLLYMVIAAFMAVLTRKNAVSVIVSLIAYISASSVKTVVFFILYLMPNLSRWLVYTPFAYTDLTGTVSGAVSIASRANLQNIGALIGGATDLSIFGVNLGLGIFYYIVGIVLFAFLTLLIFKKKQIKS